MNAYRLTQNKVYGYGTYCEAIMLAESEESARCIHPNINVYVKDNEWVYPSLYKKGEEEWVDYKDRDLVVVELIDKEQVLRALMVEPLCY